MQLSYRAALDDAPVSLVARPSAERVQRARGSSERLSMARNRILVVDDDPHLREIVAYALTEQGYDVVAAGSGEEALFELERMHGAFAAVLLDLHMPGINGDVVARECRERLDWPRMPLIAATATAGPEDVHDLFRAGFTAHLAKPFGMRDLLGVLSRHIDGRSPGSWGGDDGPQRERLHA